MSPISNAEKQDRFRKKENLGFWAEKVFRLWEMSMGPFREIRTPEEVRHALEKATELPSGWTDDDFELAKKRLGQCQLDLLSGVDQIANDVNGHWNVDHSDLMTTPDPVKFIADNKASIRKARNLAAHLISALKLSGCNDADQAAAAMEVVRFIGRSLVGSREIRRSNATAICLASVGPQYDRPKWFAEQLAETLRWQIDKSLAQEVGRQLQK
ncbi:MAG: hypothetical protein E6P95_00190 [Candidatus Moraniibacteriota bacterium]|nr:MAG: hypothetical protein E6P95_00190 [Candidatus Moranbacteria bacterium]